jgi:prepilin-type N-terminal cleavage/methylation domain-containing protein
MMVKRQQGFTLIEIAIVLVIIGLLLGGVLKGQELITGARVRNLISQQDGVKAAYFGFLDRFRALPGDYGSATTTITGVSTTSGCGVVATPGNGNGNGQIEPAAAGAPSEHTLVWEHLSKAGFINGTYTCATTVSQATSPTNPYGQSLEVAFDVNYGNAGGSTRHNLKTGGQIPSDILGEIDRKIDDGNAFQGSFRAQLNAAITPAQCYNVASGVWVSTSPGANCGGASLF